MLIIFFFRKHILHVSKTPFVILLFASILSPVQWFPLGLSTQTCPFHRGRDHRRAPAGGLVRPGEWPPEERESKESLFPCCFRDLNSACASPAPISSPDHLTRLLHPMPMRFCAFCLVGGLPAASASRRQSSPPVALLWRKTMEVGGSLRLFLLLKKNTQAFFLKKNIIMSCLRNNSKFCRCIIW